MLIQEISTGSGQRSVAELRQAALAAFFKAFPLSPYAQFYSHEGNADTPRKQSTQFSAGGTRTTSTDYTVKDRAPQFGSVALKIYGDKVETDVAYERRGYDLGSQRLLDLEDFCESLGWYFMDAVINHDTADDATQITGLKAQADDLSRKFVLGGANGLAIPAGNDNTARAAQTQLIETLDADIEDIVGGPDVIIANGKFIGRLQSIARSFVTYASVKDPFGRDERLTLYRGIPVVNAGFKNNGSGLVIPNNEVEGTSSDCTSYYLARFGERRHCTLATNVGLDVQDMGLIGTSWQSLVEFDVDLAVLHNKSILRRSGIRISN